MGIEELQYSSLEGVADSYSELQVHVNQCYF